MRTVARPRPTLVPWRRQRPSSSTIRAPSGPPAQYTLYPNGVGIAVHEWGDEDAPPLLLVHGGMDFARTYDVFAPKLAAGGMARGQLGRTAATATAPTPSCTRGMPTCATRSPSSTTCRPVARCPSIGHSKGGALMTQLADAQSFRFTHLVNMDGIPYTRRMPDIAEHERSKMMADEIAGWLDHRRTHVDRAAHARERSTNWPSGAGG